MVLFYFYFTLFYFYKWCKNCTDWPRVRPVSETGWGYIILTIGHSHTPPSHKSKVHDEMGWGYIVFGL